MASPQVEDGHVKLANELVEALARINLSSYEWRVLLCVIRKTYGWNRKMDLIPLSQLVDLTGIRKPHVCRAKGTLLKKRILVEVRGQIGLQKNYQLWESVTNLGNGVTSTGNGSVTNLGNDVTGSGNKSLPVHVTSKDNKDTYQKTNTISPNSIEFRLAKLLLDLILSRKPDFKKPNLQAWAKHVDKMIRLDKRTPDQIEMVIRWCQSDPFWQSNVLSTMKLREKFDQLELKMKGSKNAKRNIEHNYESRYGKAVSNED